MKNILTIILVTLGLCAAQAQTTMNIYQSNGTNISLPIATVDSMNFTTSPPPASLNIYQYGGGVIIVVLANIDSITYTVTSNSNGLPILSTMPLGNITNTSAVAGGNIVNDGGSPVIQRGVCWSTGPTPTIANAKTTDGSGIGNYTSNLTGLTQNTTYYVRAYASNANGTAYGNELSFITSNGGGNIGTITALNCSSANNTGTLTAGTAASGVSSSIPYTGGNGGTHNGQTVASTGVTGLTATLAAGTFSIGGGGLSYIITGTPSASGTASFALNIGGTNCTLTRAVSAAAGTITALDCSNTIDNGTLTAGNAAINVAGSIPYMGGNSGTHDGLNVMSTGVTGLMVSIAAGNFVNGNGNLSYTITGTPAASGTAIFALSIGGNSCILTREVFDSTSACIPAVNLSPGIYPPSYSVPCAVNGQFFSQDFSCALASIVNVAPFGPIAVDSIIIDSIILPAGLTILFDKKRPVYTLGSTFCFTITGTPNSECGQYLIPIYATIYFSTPFYATDLINLNNDSQLFLRLSDDGTCPTINLNQTNFLSPYSACMATGIITSIDCNTSGNNIQYTGGNGAPYSSQQIQSTGINGLTATISSGSFNWGNGSLSYTVSGASNTLGTASFEVNIGGQNCFFNKTIEPSLSSLSCTSAVNTGVIIANTPVSGNVFTEIPFVKANSNSSNYLCCGYPSYSGQTVSSTGVTGLLATLYPGTINSNSGTFTYEISGTPNSSGNASFIIDVGGRTCTLTRPVSIISSAQLNCSNVTNSGTLYANTSAAGVGITLPYTSGNGAPFYTQSFNSTGVTGLVATLDSGSLNNGNGNLFFNITGTPNSSGIASFLINFGGQSCTLNRVVEGIFNPNLTYNSVIDIDGNSYKTILIGGHEWMAENLRTTRYSNGDPINSILTGGILNSGSWSIDSIVANVYGNAWYGDLDEPTLFGNPSGAPDPGGRLSYTINGFTYTSFPDFNLNTISNTFNAKWTSADSVLRFSVANSINVVPLTISLWDYDTQTPNDQLGTATINISLTTPADIAFRTGQSAPFNFNTGQVSGTIYISPPPIWEYTNTGSWCYYNNDSSYNYPYGKLYNWYSTIDARNVCPVGWHVPNDSEWDVLVSQLAGGATIAGGELKSTGYQYWLSPNTSATNNIGFSALPGGKRHSQFNQNGGFLGMNNSSDFWSSTIPNGWPNFNPSSLGLGYATAGASLGGGQEPKYGLSIRCKRN